MKEPCDKIAYISKRQAKTAKWKMERNVGWRMTVYQCPACRKWHLATKQKHQSKLRFHWKPQPKPHRRAAVWEEDGMD